MCLVGSEHKTLPGMSTKVISNQTISLMSFQGPPTPKEYKEQNVGPYFCYFLVFCRVQNLKSACKNLFFFQQYICAQQSPTSH